VIRRSPLRALVFAGLILVSAGTANDAQSIQGPREEPVGPPAQVHASADRTAIWVGDRITYAVDIVCRRGVEILLDDLAKEKLRLNGLDVVNSDSTTTVDAAERTTYRLRYVLTTYRVDVPSLSIEPLSARYYERRPGQRLQDITPAGEVQVPGAVIALRSTLPDQPVYELRDGRAPAPRHALMARTESIGLALIVISLAPAAFMAAVLLRRRPRTSGRRSAREARLDHRATLERLRALDVATEEERRRAYDEISAAVRQHLAVTSGVPAAGLTATEVDAALEQTTSRRVSRESVTALLVACDEARYGPPHALPSAQACRDALAAAEQVLGGG
jgi:hypothetical protein